MEASRIFTIALESVKTNPESKDLLMKLIRKGTDLDKACSSWESVVELIDEVFEDRFDLVPQDIKKYICTNGFDNLNSFGKLRYCY